ncbi:MAG: cytochrome P450 [Deltaproteobacteria bacterium]|nr:cytochrome P450 [Deltaproteobacteria bacterium]MBW2389660.1 cytochrome P450 [Deltaproteobacteria bacterium]MBW2724556.1 cytochrome P450 [Deltaproteobacteria bacterium]
MSQSPDANPIPSLGQAGADPYSIPLDKIDVSDGEIFETDTLWGYFERLRKEDPVHYCAESEFGPYWSVTRFDDIVYVEKNHETFSSARSIVVGDPDPDFPLEAGFITMDGPRHDAHRKTVQPVAAPRNLKLLEPLIRERVIEILEGLPLDETFDWVDRVSIELTTGMLATLFDFPYEQRRKLTFWSDMATASPVQVGSLGITEGEREAALMECLEVFTKLWKERENKPQGERLDLITALANGAATRDLAPMEYLGTLVLLIVGGNDTTRNSISGGVLALNENPKEYQKLRDKPELIPNMVSEMIRWQTPLAHMRRTATKDTELGGKQIKKGDKVVMWYVSGNRDESVIERANEFLIDRENARQHLSFGWGVHFCMGSRLAEMQLRILWEEILVRFREVEVVGKPVRVRSNFVKGFTELPVRLHPR